MILVKRMDKVVYHRRIMQNTNIILSIGKYNSVTTKNRYDYTLKEFESDDYWVRLLMEKSFRLDIINIFIHVSNKGFILC